MTATVWVAIASVVSTPAGLSRPVRVASLRIRYIAAGYPAHVPKTEQHPRDHQDRQVRRERADHAGEPSQCGAGEEKPPRPEQIHQPADHWLPYRGRQIERRDQPRGL
nr:hypothetical protein [Fodinicola feengrottensis]